MLARQFLHWIEGTPPRQRGAAARALARAYELADDDDIRNGMEAAITVLVDGAMPEVRLALADGLASSPDTPRHIVIALAADLPEIAEVVLARSPVLIDAELVDIAAAASGRLQAAVASRATVSGPVAAAIAEVGESAACLALLANAGAEVARISFKRVAERFGDDPEVREALLDRPDLPAEARQVLVRAVSDALGGMMVTRAWASAERADTVTREACEKATVALAAESQTDELPALVEHLRVTGQLTTGLLLRAVCAGNVALFEAALARLASVPPRRVAHLVRGGRARALRAVYRKAGLPPFAFAAFAAALDTWRQLAGEGTPADRYRFTRRMVDAVLARYDGITDSEMNELTAMLRRFAADQARAAARDSVAIADAA
jgi:uncharacterized protein (DUF2336 family)